jgi:hypothetical protein
MLDHINVKWVGVFQFHIALYSRYGFHVRKKKEANIETQNLLRTDFV